MRLPRGIILPGFRVFFPSGEFYSRNQPPVPPGLTISPQADTTCPAARDEINRVGMDVKFFEMKALGAIHPLHKWRGLLAQIDKSTAGIDEYFPQNQLCQFCPKPAIA